MNSERVKGDAQKPVSSTETQWLFAQAEEEVERSSNVLSEIQSLLSLESNEREMISQSLIVINALSRMCRRMKDDTDTSNEAFDSNS